MHRPRGNTSRSRWGSSSSTPFHVPCAGHHRLLQPTLQHVFRQPRTRLIQRTTLPLNLRLFKDRTILLLLRTIRHVNIHVIRRPLTHRGIPRRRRNNNSGLTRINASRVFNTLESVHVVIRTMHKGPSSNIIRGRTSRHTSRRSSSLRPTDRVIPVLRRSLRTNRMIRSRKSSGKSNNNRRVVRIRRTSRGVRSTPISSRNSRTRGTRFRRLFGRFFRARCWAHTHEPPELK